MKQFVFDTIAKNAVVIDGLEEYQIGILGGCFHTAKFGEYELFNSSAVSGADLLWSVKTSFTGYDAREKWPNTKLANMPCSLPFVSARFSGDRLLKTYWSTYEQAELGHKLAVSVSSECELERRTDLYYQLAQLSKDLGIDDIALLTLNSDDISRVHDKPITIPPAGYQSDIEAYIEL